MLRYKLRTLLILLAVAVWSLPVMYFLSIAPARKLVHEGSMPQDAYLAIYGYCPPQSWATVTVGPSTPMVAVSRHRSDTR